MKQKDLAIVIFIAILSSVIALVASNLIFVPPANRQQQVEVVPPISATFNDPDPAYFNKDSFDPTQTISIGQNTNTNPFSSKTDKPR